MADTYAARRCGKIKDANSCATGWASTNCCFGADSQCKLCRQAQGMLCCGAGGDDLLNTTCVDPATDPNNCGMCLSHFAVVIVSFKHQQQWS